MAFSRRTKATGWVFAATAVAALVWTFWLGPELARGRREQAVVRRLEGVADIDTNWFGAVIEVHFRNIDGTTLKELSELELPDLVSLKATNSRFQDDDFKLFSEFHRLEALDLSKTPVSPAGVTHLCELSAPLRLNLRGTGVEFAQVQRLERAVPGIDVTY